MSSVHVIDYGMGNLGSLERFFEDSGFDCFIASNPEELLTASKIILPGVGGFSEGMKHLKEAGWDRVIHEKSVKSNTPLLGICLGMQMLAEKGTEGGDSQGLGLIKGSVERISPSINEKIPHVGWNNISILKADSPLLSGIPNNSDFYFVHSFYFRNDNDEDLVATVDYSSGLTAIVQKGNVFGTQFHPEKSSKIGRKILNNFMEL